jgi:hypothetical protein
MSRAAALTEGKKVRKFLAPDPGGSPSARPDAI